MLLTVRPLSYILNHVSISETSIMIAKLRAWLISVDVGMLEYEDWLVKNKFYNPKRLKFFNPVDLKADNIFIAVCDKNMLLAAIAKLPDIDAWPLYI